MSQSRYYVQGEQFSDGRFYYVVDRQCGCPYQSVFNHEHMVSRPTRSRKRAQRMADKLEERDVQTSR